MLPDLQTALQKTLQTDTWLLANKFLVTERDDLWCCEGKLYVPEMMHKEILRRCHDDKISGYFGFVKTLHLTRRQFWWPTLCKDIKDYVASCSTCAMAKQKGGKPQGLLQSVANPSKPWKQITMDFIVDLPESKKKTAIWVVVDLFSKQAHFVPCAKIPTAQQLAQLFLQHVYRLHGCPECVISDRGMQFSSKFWKSFLALLGTKQTLSSLSHPQTDGATEQLNSTLEQFLHCYINYQQDDWVDLLPFAEVAYNNSIH